MLSISFHIELQWLISDRAWWKEIDGFTCPDLETSEIILALDWQNIETLTVYIKLVILHVWGEILQCSEISWLVK